MRRVHHDVMLEAVIAHVVHELLQPRHASDSAGTEGVEFVVGECAFALWTSVQDGPTGFETIMHGADFYRFSDGMVAAKIAYRKNRQS